VRLKHGVKLTDLKPQMVLAAFIVAECMKRLDPGCSATITSANDSKHKDGSLHYFGRAFDFRTKDFGGSKAQLVLDIRTALGQDFDVLLEAEGTVNEHLHLEWDEK
jgi:hypothetical protein